MNLTENEWLRLNLWMHTLKKVFDDNHGTVVLAIDGPGDEIRP
jgi:hypothetical protein